MILTNYLINGQDLIDEHSSLIVGTTHFTSISTRVNSVSVNGRNGVMLPGGPAAFEAPDVTLRFITNGPDADTLMHRFYRLCRLAESLTRVERDTSTGLTRRMTAKCVCTSCQPDGDEIPWISHRAATAVFQLPDVFWEGEQWQTVTLAASGGVLISGAKPTKNSGWYSNAPLQNLVMRFASVTSVTVTDPVSGTDLAWSGASASYLYVDVPNRRAWTASKTDAWTGGTDVTSGIDWSGEPLQVWPSAETCDYTLQVKQSGTTGVACRYKASWE